MCVCFIITVSNALLMSNATAMVRMGGMGWLKPVATVLLMLCSAVFGFEPVLCCDVWYVLCYVWKNHLSSVFAITDKRDIGLYDAPMLMSLLGLGLYYYCVKCFAHV